MTTDTSHELTEAVGRLLIVGFEGTEFPEVEALVTAVRPAGLIFFKRNYPAEGPRQLRTLIEAVQSLARAELGRELFIAIDHEGGRVQRLPRPYTPLPPAGRAQAEADYLQLVERGARELVSTGFNFNFAPVVDVSAPVSGVLGDRAFSDDPATVADLGRACLEIFHRAGILGAGKHFPGLGAAVVDPHHELPTIRSEAGRLMDVDMRPFLELAAPPADLLAIMTTHALYPALDSEHPATFSEDIVGLLKNELAFPGAALTDDLEMGAVVKNFPLGEAAVKAVQAGHDLALVCRKREYIDECRRALASALRSGVLPETRLNEAHARSELLRNRLQSIKPPQEELDAWFRELT
ncbi:MAG: beta-N-acetylhexosaminidase [Candidatus Adiutrix sp.]|nr:beta-N-acetylhexosaminidase [Candidatus Adiutrix sp.]